MTRMRTSLRRVTERDLRQIFEWRRSPQVRKQMISRSVITWRGHKRFWAKRLRSENPSFIVRFDGQDAGLVRLDAVENAHEVGICINPKMHGKGIGSAALAEVVKLARKKNLKKLLARIKLGNAASHRIFEKIGFKPIYMTYELRLKK